MTKVIFDSNVWRVVATPTEFPNNPDLAEAQKIASDAADGKITPLLAETVFTLEALRRSDRRTFFANYSPDTSLSESVNENGQITLPFSLGPQVGAHPGNNSYLSRHLQDALQIGFKVLKIPRIGGIVNPDIDSHLFLSQEEDEVHRRMEWLGDVSRQIERRGCGMSHIKSIGGRYAGSD